MHGLLSLFDDWQSRVHSEINSTVPCFYKNKNPLTYWDWVSLYYSFMWLTIIGIGIIIGAMMGGGFQQQVKVLATVCSVPLWVQSQVAYNMV